MTYQIKNICCIGAGYVGGPTMAVIANYCPNIQVNVVDIDPVRIKNWNSKDLSRLPVYEKGLKEIIRKCRDINLHFSIDINKHISKADMIFISVNTPIKIKGFGAGQASDLKWVESSARQISKFAKGKTIVVEKSTLPVKTASLIKQILEIDNTNEENKVFHVLSNPEFLAEGTAINDLQNPDRVLIGGSDKEAIKALVNIYTNWVPSTKILTTDLWSSELSKLIANAFLAQRISSINSISALCEMTGADVKDVSSAIGMDKRIGQFFLNPGPGFGGSCFKKDILNLVYICNHYGLKEVAQYWEKVIEINHWQQKRISKIFVEKLFGTITEKRIAIFGFAFKANTNDTRESPSISICKDLLEEGARISIYDPKVTRKQIGINLNMLESRSLSNESNGSWTFSKSTHEAAENADAILVLTEWEEFKDLDFKNISKIMRKPSWIFDTRSIINVEEAKLYGINVWNLGKGN